MDIVKCYQNTVALIIGSIQKLLKQKSRFLNWLLTEHILVWRIKTNRQIIIQRGKLNDQIWNDKN